MWQPRMMSGPGIARSQDFISGAGARFRLGRNLWTVGIRETLGVIRMTYWSGSSPAGCIPIEVTVTLSDMSGHLFVAVIS
jgi:hypothetical protein